MVHQSVIQLRFRDTDGMGHVNNAVYATYLEYARFDWFRTHFAVENLTDFPFILARVEIDYRHSIPVNAQPVVSLWVTDIGASSWTFAYKIHDLSDPSVLYAEGKSVQVAFNYKTGKKEPLASELREILEQETSEE